MNSETDSRSRAISPIWILWVCGLLLCASTINYLDRQTLSNVSQRITREFELSEEQYGNLELAFGWAFAAGATCFGFIADKTSVRWLYPAVLLAWSVMGFATGFAETYAGLLICRLLLGLFEAGHWPCALKTTQKLLPPSSRTLGNSVLQSGTAIGAIITPLVMKVMLTDQPGSWRPAFQIIGAIGVVWAVLWWISIREDSLVAEDSQTPTTDSTGQKLHTSFAQVLVDHRFWLLFVVVITINLCWHLFRVWLPKFLQNGRGYSEDAMLNINFWFNVATDVGCLSAGFATALLHRSGWSVFVSRTAVFTVCCLATASTLAIPLLPQGWLLLGVLLIVGMGSLGQFPCYYAYSQELSHAHQGKVTGLLGTTAWLVTSPSHKFFGRWVDGTGSYDAGLAIVGALPLVGCLLLWVCWRPWWAERPASD